MDGPQDADDLPVELPNGLLMRWATDEDTEELAAFNLAFHSNDPEDPEQFLLHWTRDLMSGIHPTTRADDFTVVVDTNNNNRIVSSICLISQVWTFGGIPVPVGRPELVATHPDYRRQGLVRRQMGIIHARSAARGELMSIITGIPWYYRQFGYDMAVESGGSRQFFWARPGNSETVAQETYILRPATVIDIPVLEQLYARFTADSLLAQVRPRAHWRYQLEDAHAESVGHVNYQIIEDEDGQPVAYVVLEQWGTSFSLTEMGVMAGHSWRAVLLFLTRELKRRADALNLSRDNPITNVNFVFGTSHAVYEALGNQLERQVRPYAYYVRVLDIVRLLHLVAPVLEVRLANSVLAGHSGMLKVNLFRGRFALTWDKGKLTTIGSFDGDDVEDGDIRFPDLTFLQILFGYRSYEELHLSYADCYASNVEGRLLTEVLFPKLPSHIWPLN